MRSITVVTLLMLAGTLLSCPTAAAGVPTAASSYVQTPVIVCPAGDSEFKVIVRRFNFPYANAEVDLRFGLCPGVQFPPVLGDEGYAVQPVTSAPSTCARLIKVADDLGHAIFTIRAGGTCPAGGVEVYASSVPFGSRAVASPDQDGNLGVGADDLALAEAKLGSADPTADFDGDGTVTSADLDFVRGHLGHYAPGMATPVTSRSWGAIKLLYQ